MIPYSNLPSQWGVWGVALPAGLALLQLLASLHPVVWLAVFLPLTLVAAVWAAVTWIVHFQHGLATRLAYSRAFQPIVVWICRVERLPFPSSPDRPGPPAPQPLSIRPATREDWDAVAQDLRDVYWGYDAAIARLVSRVEHAAQDWRSRRGGPHPPIAINLLIGAEGLGKLGLARRLGAALWGGPQHVFDLRDYEPEAEALRYLAGLSTSRTGGTLILDHFQRSSPTFQQAVQAIAEGERPGLGSGIERGAFGNWFVFLIVHQEAAEPRDDLPDGELVARRTGLPVGLATLAPATAFALPEPDILMYVVGKLLMDEARRTGFDVVHVDPELIAGECVRAMEDGGLASVRPFVIAGMTRARIAAREGLADPIKVAKAGGE